MPDVTTADIPALAREAVRLHALALRRFIEWERELEATEPDPLVRKRAARDLSAAANRAHWKANDALKIACGRDQALYDAAVAGALLEAQP